MNKSVLRYCPSCGKEVITGTAEAFCPDNKGRACPFLLASPASPHPPAPRDPLLVERQETHGNFADNAMISQELKEIFRKPRPNMSPPSLSVHREALDMIALKLLRILSGQAHYADHWADIAGYAKLAKEACLSMRGLTDYVEPKK